MEKILKVFFITFFISFFVFQISFAQKQQVLGYFSFKDFFQRLGGKLFEWAGWLAYLAIAVCFLLIASSGGDPRRLNDAKRALLYVAIGFVIIQIGNYYLLKKGTLPAGGEKGFQEMVKFIVQIIGRIAAITGVLFLGYGVFEFATSAGDERRVQEAKMILFWSAIGIICGIFFQNWQGLGEKWTAGSVAKYVIEILGRIATLIGALILAWGTFLIATSAGDAKRLAEGKLVIVWGGIGVILGSFLINLDNLLNYFGLKINW